jgi:outer membrane immunogenic protein
MIARYRVLTVCAGAALALSAGARLPAMGQSRGDFAQVMAAMKQLEERVAALEGENKEARKQTAAARAEAQALRQKLGTTSGAQRAPELPHDPYSMATKAASLSPLPASWSGVYTGLAFGGAWASAKIASQETYTSMFPTNAPPFQTNGTSTSATSRGSDGYGAVFDGFVGVNAELMPRFVIGMQLEGTVSDVNFSSSGTRNLTYFNAAGPTGQTAAGPFRPNVQARWMASALMRVGVLADSDTLLYAIGGWTGAQFEYGDLTDNPFFEPKDTFWANGGSAGVGIERRFGASWSLRTEYRYTQFQNRNIANDFFWTSSFPSTQANSIQTSFRNAMQTVRIGVSYQLPQW